MNIYWSKSFEQFSQNSKITDHKEERRQHFVIFCVLTKPVMPGKQSPASQYNRYRYHLSYLFWLINPRTRHTPCNLEQFLPPPPPFLPLIFSKQYYLKYSKAAALPRSRRMFKQYRTVLTSHQQDWEQDHCSSFLSWIPGCWQLPAVMSNVLEKFHVLAASLIQPGNFAADSLP